MNHPSVATRARRLRSLRAPDEQGAEQRAWEVVQEVYAERVPARSRRVPLRLALVPIAAVVAGVLALTPAGAAVHRWLDQTLGVRHARAALFSVPGGGQLLLSGPGGTWTAAADGSKRRLGSWPHVAWSPHARYVAVARGDELRAVNPRGVTQWEIARPRVRFPRWFAPTGYRVAYLSGAALRVIAGDGTGDRLLAKAAAAVAPAWRPGHAYQLAYVTGNGTVVLRDADTGRISWSSHRIARPRSLAWSASGQRLLVRARSAITVLSGDGKPLVQFDYRSARAPIDAALSPDGQTLALLSDRDLTLTSLPPLRQSARRLFTGEGLRQVAFSPGGDWVLVSWPAADQWIFLHARGRPRVIAVSRIAEQFSGAQRRAAFPQLAGWCCTAGGVAG